MVTPFTGFRRILVAIDFSPHSNAALAQAVWLARHSSAEIMLAHTLPNLRQVVHTASTRAKLDLLQGDGSEFELEVRKSSDLKMKRMIADLGASDLSIKYETLIGEPYIELTHAVQAENYDLLLAGSRGLSNWTQFFVGSTAVRLIRKCPATVWIAKAGHTERLAKVLAPTDFSDVSLKAARQGYWLAKQSGAEFHLLHVIDSMDVPEDVFAKAAEGSTIRDEINREAKNHMESFLATLDNDTSSVNVHLTWGSPWKETKRIAEQLNADLITMGTIGRTGIQGVFLGNTAEKILNACDVSILAVKPDDYVSPIQPAAWKLHP